MGDMSVELRAPIVELDVIDLAARVAGMSVGEFLLWSASRLAREVLLDGAEGVHIGGAQACGHLREET